MAEYSKFFKKIRRGDYDKSKKGGYGTEDKKMEQDQSPEAKKKRALSRARKKAAGTW